MGINMCSPGRKTVGFLWSVEIVLASTECYIEPPRTSPPNHLSKTYSSK